MRSKLAKVLHRAAAPACWSMSCARRAAWLAPLRITAVIGHQAEQVRAEVAARHRIRRADGAKGTRHALQMCDGQAGLDEGAWCVARRLPAAVSGAIQRLLRAHENRARLRP